MEINTTFQADDDNMKVENEFRTSINPTWIPQQLNKVEGSSSDEQDNTRSTECTFNFLLEHDYCNFKTVCAETTFINKSKLNLDNLQELKTVVGPNDEKCIVYDIEHWSEERINWKTEGVIWKDIGKFKLNKEEFSTICPNGDKLVKYSCLMRDKLQEILPFCPTAFRGVYYNKTLKFFTLRAYCLHPICRSFQIQLAASPDPLDEHHGYVAASDDIARHLNQKITTPLNQNERVEVKKVLRFQSAFQYRQECILKADDTILEAGNLQKIKSLSTLRTVRHEIHTENDLDKDDFIALHSLYKKNYQNEEERFIQSIETPLKVILNSKSQMEVLKTITRKKNTTGLTVYLDATGSLFSKPPCVDNQILLYAGVVNVVKNHFPILLYVSSQHTQSSISKWLENSIEFASQYGINLKNAVNRVVTDFSPALMNAVLQAFNNLTMTEYLEACHCIIERKSTGNNTIHTFLQLCTAHFMHLVAKNVKLRTDYKNYKRMKHPIMRTFGCLVSMGDLEEMKLLFGYLCVLLDSEFQNELVTEALEQIDKFSQKFNVDSFNEVLEEKEKQDPEESETGKQNHKEQSPIYLKSRMYHVFLGVREKRKQMVKDLMQGRKELIKNEHQNVDLLTYMLRRYMTYVSLWTLLIHPNRTSNAAIEAWFKLLKYYIVNKLNDKSQRTVEAVHEYIKSEVKAISNEIPIEKCCLTKKRKHHDIEDKFMSKEESWGKRRKHSRKSAWFPEHNIDRNAAEKNRIQHEPSTCFGVCQPPYSNNVHQPGTPFHNAQEGTCGDSAGRFRLFGEDEVFCEREEVIGQWDAESFNMQESPEPEFEGNDPVIKGAIVKPEPGTPLGTASTGPQMKITEPYVPNDSGKVSKETKQNLEEEQQIIQYDGAKCDTEPVVTLEIWKACDGPGQQLETTVEPHFMIEENTHQEQDIPRNAVVQPLFLHPKSKLVLNHGYYVEIARPYTICAFDETKMFALFSNGKIKIDQFKCLNMNIQKKKNYLSDLIIDTIVSLFFSEKFGTDDSKYCYIPCVLSTNALNNKMPGVYKVFRDKLPNSEFLIMPYYQEQLKHWCLVYVNIKIRSFMFFDPMHNHNQLSENDKMFSHFLVLWDKVSMYSKYKPGKKWHIANTSHARQRDGYNCGVFVLSQIYKILNSNTPFDYEEFDGNLYRRELQTFLLANSSDMTNVCMFCDKEDEAGNSDLSEWVQCNLCDRWSHQSCVGNKNKINYSKIKIYNCGICRKWLRRNE